MKKLLGIVVLGFLFSGNAYAEKDHAHSNSVLLEPKEKQDLIWKFSKAQNIEIACNVPGHYDVGMIAQVKINQ